MVTATDERNSAKTPLSGTAAIDADAVVEEVYRNAYLRLVRNLCRVTRDTDDAHEVVQEAFLRAVTKARAEVVPDTLEAWIWTVARNLACNRFRRRRLMERFLWNNRHPSESAGPEPDRVALVAVIKRLPPAQREAVGLFYLVDLSIDDISARLGVPVGTVKARLSRGRATLAAILGRDRNSGAGTSSGG